MKIYHIMTMRIFKFFNFGKNKMTIKEIRNLFGPSEFDRAIKNNHLKQELNMNDQATVEFVEQDDYGLYIYKMTMTNGQQIRHFGNDNLPIYIVTTKKHDID